MRGDEGARENTRVDELVEELRLLTLADARMHGASIRFDLDGEMPEVFVHPTQITQALLNLIRNALESVGRRPAGRARDAGAQPAH